MQKYNILVPIVFDDIFYASDFDNRMKLKSFFENVLSYYDVQIKKKTTYQKIFN